MLAMLPTYAEIAVRALRSKRTIETCSENREESLSPVVLCTDICPRDRNQTTMPMNNTMLMVGYITLTCIHIRHNLPSVLLDTIESADGETQDINRILVLQTQITVSYTHLTLPTIYSV